VWVISAVCAFPMQWFEALPCEVSVRLVFFSMPTRKKECFQYPHPKSVSGGLEATRRVACLLDKLRALFLLWVSQRQSALYHSCDVGLSDWAHSWSCWSRFCLSVVVVTLVGRNCGHLSTWRCSCVGGVPVIVGDHCERKRPYSLPVECVVETLVWPSWGRFLHRGSAPDVPARISSIDRSPCQNDPV